MNSTPCTVCGEGGHAARKCPTLSDPLKEGFYKGQVPRGGGGEEDDEHLGLRVRNYPMPIFLHTSNFCISYHPVVMKKIESIRRAL